MSQAPTTRKKPKWGARLVRGFVYGLTLGFTLFVIGNTAANAINAAATTTVVNAQAWGLMGFVVGLGAAIGIEISKEME